MIINALLTLIMLWPSGNEARDAMDVASHNTQSSLQPYGGRESICTL